MGYAPCFLAGILWGTVGLFVNLMQQEGATTSQIPCLRLGFAAGILFVAILVTRGLSGFRMDAKGLLACAALGLLTQALFNNCYIRAIASCGMSLGVILLYTSPVFVCVLSVLFFRERMTLRKGISLTLNLASCVLVVTGGDFTSLHAPALGLLLGLAAGFLYSLMTIIGRIATGKQDPLLVTFYGLFFGFLFLTLMNQPWEIVSESHSWRLWLYGALFGLVPTAGSYLLYFQGLKGNVEVSRAPVISSVETVAAVLIGVLALGEDWGPVQMVGIIGVLLSIVIINFSPQRKEPQHEPTEQVL